jgi:hypothetical protein
MRERMRQFRLVSLIVVLALSAHFSRGQTTFEPRNLIDIRVSARASRNVDGGLMFHYAIANSVGAKQSIWKFTLLSWGSPGVEKITGAVNWNKSVFQKDTTIVKWFGQARDDVDQFKDEIKPGDSRDGFGFESRSLPGLITCYSEGWADPPKFKEGMATDSIPGYTDLTPYGPGVVGRTIGPVLPPDLFDPMVFLDTLLSYTAQSKALGWIMSETAAAKYAGYFTSAKTCLQTANLGAARRALKQVLQDANADSTSTITSEAYALLRYDTESLLGKLPAPPEITALTPSMTIAGSGAFNLTVSGNNFVEASKVNWSGSVRTTAYVADTVLRASILAADAAAVGSPIVTVKNPDGNESDGIKFYVISTVAWVDTLIACKHRAFDRGWIDDAGVANSLDQKLENARKLLQQGNNKSAKNVLEAFVNELEAQKGKHVSAEAYALLKPNVAYLISKL